MPKITEDDYTPLERIGAVLSGRSLNVEWKQGHDNDGNPIWYRMTTHRPIPGAYEAARAARLEHDEHAQNEAEEVSQGIIQNIMDDKHSL